MAASRVTKTPEKVPSFIHIYASLPVDLARFEKTDCLGLDPKFMGCLEGFERYDTCEYVPGSRDVFLGYRWAPNGYSGVTREVFANTHLLPRKPSYEILVARRVLQRPDISHEVMLGMLNGGHEPDESDPVYAALLSRYDRLRNELSQAIRVQQRESRNSSLPQGSPLAAS